MADIHFGKAAAFRSRSIPLPHGTTQANFDRLDLAIRETGAERLVVLGDLWHDRLGRSDALLERVGEWRRQHERVEFILVTGNHDCRAGATPIKCGFLEVDELCIGPFCCLHDPIDREGAYVLAGHLHPAVRLGGGRNSFMVPCFWFTKGFGVLPAFGEFTGTSEIPASAGDRILAVSEEFLSDVSGLAAAAS